MKQRLLVRLLEEKEMKLKGGLYHQTQIKLAYNSNRIEGSRLSEDQTRYIYETNTVNMEQDEAANVDDIIETVNHFSCFDYMLVHADEELTEEMIKEFHRLLKRNTSDERKEWFRVGDYKTKPNVVGDMKTTAPTKVISEIQKLLTDYHQKIDITIDNIVDFHYRFESIHPFQDGNGRVGRIIMFKECLKTIFYLLSLTILINCSIIAALRNTKLKKDISWILAYRHRINTKQWSHISFRISNNPVRKCISPKNDLRFIVYS